MPNDDETLQYTLSYRDAVDILRLVKESEQCASLEIQFGDMKLSLTRAVAREAVAQSVPRNMAAPTAAPANAPPPKASAATKGSSAGAAAALPPGCVAITAPMLGTFYRAPTPNAPPFVKPGDRVKSGDTVGLIEVMKLFTPITSGVAGRVVQILVEDSMLVEHGQALVALEPD